jgi:hypothetical protein
VIGVEDVADRGAEFPLRADVDAEEVPLLAAPGDAALQEEGIERVGEKAFFLHPEGDRPPFAEELARSPIVRFGPVIAPQGGDDEVEVDAGFVGRPLGHRPSVGDAQRPAEAAFGEAESAGFERVFQESARLGLTEYPGGGEKVGQDVGFALVGEAVGQPGGWRRLAPAETEYS